VTAEFKCVSGESSRLQQLLQKQQVLWKKLGNRLKNWAE